MQKRIKALYIFCCLCVFALTTNAQQTFNERYKEIEKQLNIKANSDIPELLEIAQFSIVNSPIEELIRGVAEAHKLNVSIAPSINRIITNNFTNVQVKDLLLFVCKEYKLDILFINNILSFVPFDDPPEKKIIKQRKLPKIEYERSSNLLTVDLYQDSASVFVRQLSRITSKNVLLGPNVEDRLMKGYVTKVPFEQGLEKLSFSNGFAMEADSASTFFLLMEPELKEEVQEIKKADNRTNNSRYTSKRKAQERKDDNNLVISKVSTNYLNIQASNIPIATVIEEAAEKAGRNYVFLSKPEGNIYLQLNKISFGDLLTFLLKGTKQTFINKKNVHLIGARIDEGFRSTKIVKFQHRAATEIEKSIPEILSKDLQIMPFEELNSLILCGSSTQVNEVERFLIDIDQPVPNIMIDVIVLDVRKSTSLSVGLSAFLADTTIATNGKIHPGVDMTLGSSSVNSVLNRFQNATSINLGRVKSNFYVKLNALEQNGNVKIKSTPKLSTLNGHEATLTIGESVYYQEKTQNVTGGVNPIITTTPRFNKVDANLNIKIKPVVSGNDNVTLDIEAEFSDFLAPEIDDAPPGNSTRKFISQIRVKNEEVILLGGLEETSKENTGSGIPFLSRIPVLKWFFSNRTKNTKDNKLLILIKPQIVY